MITLKNPGQVSASGDGVGGFCNDTIERACPGAFNMSKFKDYTGKSFNGIKYLYDTDCIKKHRRAMFECFCGNKFESFISCVVVGNTKSCGCKTYEWKSKASSTHRMSKTQMYDRWVNIKYRCFSDACSGYKNYGGRGIKIYEPWVNDFMLFYNYVNGLPFFGKKGYSIDRIDNNGNYEPGNLRWANRRTQASNARSTNKLGYTGICKCKNKIQSRITVNYKSVHLGSFESIREAVKARNEYIIDNNLPHIIQNYNG